MKLNPPSLRSIFSRELLFSLATFLFLIPKPYLTIPELDASWQVTLEEAFFKNWEFGTTVNFTGGPLSLLYSPTSLGYHVFGQVAAESMVLIIALFIIFRALRGQSIGACLLVFGTLILSAALGKDGIYLVSIGAGAFILLRSEKPGRVPVYLIPAFMALLSLMKFSFASLGLACLFILALNAVIHAHYGKAAKLLVSFIVTFLLLWILIGQNLRTIPAFIINSLQISQGYLWNMNLHENRSTFLYLIFYLLLVSLPILFVCLAIRKKIHAWLTLILAACTIYLSWKAGITRAGSHMGFFLQAAFIIVILVQPLVGSKIWSRIWITGVVAAFLTGLIWVYPTGPKPIASTTWKVFTGNLRFLANPDSLNQSFTRIIPMVIAENELPEVKKRVQESSIDVLQYQQSILLLNDLNFQPRPTVQNYPAYNHHLMTLNLRHMRNNPPRYLLMKYGSVDQRYPYSDDSLYNLEVFQNYRPLLGEKGYMLLERTAEPNLIKPDSVVLEKTIQSGENVDIAQYSEQLLWLSIDYTPSWMHRLVAFLYKPEIIIMRVGLEDGTHKNFRLVGGNLKDGFLLNPLLEGNVALERFLNTQLPQTKIISFTVASIPGNTFFNTTRFNLRLSSLKSEATP